MNDNNKEMGNMRKLLFLFAFFALAGFSFAGKGLGNNQKADLYLTPKLRIGETLSNIFSRTISYKPESADEAVWRASGTAIYTVVDNSPANLSLDGQFRYDGRPQSTGKTVIKDSGKTLCYKDKCGLNTDASGLLYNPFLWGNPNGALKTGATWNVSLTEPWELGPPGQETVTVMSVDPVNHSVTLKREGSGEGFFADDAKQIHVNKEGKPYLVDVVPGKSHWTGYTTFREGVVISDELLVDRSVTLVSKELGSIPTAQREYILLNAMPSPLK
jgi:hypothetical protein